MPDAAKPLVCFGDFELNLQSGELQRNGHRRRLPQQSFRILTFLLKKPGEVVTREELRKELWPDNTFVDFEHGMNSAVRRLREALNDSAEEPKFIETLPRLGYRYLGPLVTNRPLHAQEGHQTAVVEELTEAAPSNGAPERLSYTLGDSAKTPTGVGTIPQKDDKFIAPVEVFQCDGYKPRYGLKAVVHAQPVKQGRQNLLLFGGACAALILLLAGIIWRRTPREPRVTRVVQLTNDARVRSPFRQPVTDGLHLYFVEGATAYSGSGIAQMSALGGETTQLETPLREPSAIYGISPDFSELLVANGASGRPDAATIWAQPLPAGTPHRVGNIHASAACYTPDGTQILYADGDSLIKINRDGSNPRELAKVPRDLIKVRGVALRGLRYSPDGKRIRFHIDGYPSDTSSLWEIEANGSNLHALLPNWKEASSQCCGNWSADGQYYFFQGRQGNDQAIWVMPERGYIFAGGPGKPSRLISGPLRVGSPVPSIDGKKLFVVGEERRVEPVRYDSETHRLESYLNSISTTAFEFSPDRKRIAYVSYPDMSLWRSRVDGTDKMQLTLPPVRAFLPHWSPDGSKIAFMDVQLGHSWTVSLISSSGEPLQSFPGADPNWTPDGRSIVWTLSNPYATVRYAGIFRLDLDSGKTSSIPNSVGRHSSRVSPDGRYVAAFSEAATELLLFDSKIQQWSTLAKGELLSFNLWSPDGKYVYMRSNVSYPRIVRVHIPDGRMEEVVSLKGFPQAAGDPSVGWFGLTPDGDVVVIHDRSTQEIYALDVDLP